jgi:nitrogen fixation protein FixH
MPIDDRTQDGECRQWKVTGRTVLACLGAFFAVVVGVNAIMVHAAVSTFGGVETASSYQAGLAFARESDAARAQDALRWRVAARLSAASAESTRIDIAATDAANRPLSGLVARARLSHPTDKRADHTLALSESSPGHFIGKTAQVRGQWDLVIELLRDGERVFRSRNRLVVR